MSDKMAVVFPSSPTVGQQYTDATSNTKFYWTGTYWRGVNAQGAKGDKGEQGEQGIPGTAVAKGDKGDQGDTGLAGSKGEKGDTGTKGDQGPIAPKNLVIYTRVASSNINLSSVSYVTIVGRSANTDVNLTI